MNKFCVLSLALLWTATASAAEDFDGSRPMDCKPLQVHDCLPTEKTCKPPKPEPGKDETMHVDVARMSVKTPFRNDTLPIASYEFNAESLVMQGTSLEFVWSATIHRTNGKLIITLADREGAYVIFGQCALSVAVRSATSRAKFLDIDRSGLTDGDEPARDKRLRSGERGRVASFGKPLDECAERAMVIDFASACSQSSVSASSSSQCAPCARASRIAPRIDASAFACWPRASAMLPLSQEKLWQVDSLPVGVYDLKRLLELFLGAAPVAVQKERLRGISQRFALLPAIIPSAMFFSYAARICRKPSSGLPRRTSAQPRNQRQAALPWASANSSTSECISSASAATRSVSPKRISQSASNQIVTISAIGCASPRARVYACCSRSRA